jgi:hypothetical protein
MSARPGTRAERQGRNPLPGHAMTRPAASVATSQRWRRLMPVVFITYSFAYVDRSNYSLGAAGGLTHDLHITTGQAGLLCRHLHSRRPRRWHQVRRRLPVPGRLTRGRRPTHAHRAGTTQSSATPARCRAQPPSWNRNKWQQ